MERVKALSQTGNPRRTVVTVDALHSKHQASHRFVAAGVRCHRSCQQLFVPTQRRRLRRRGQSKPQAWLRISSIVPHSLEVMHNPCTVVVHCCICEHGKACAYPGYYIRVQQFARNVLKVSMHAFSAAGLIVRRNLKT